MRTFTKRMPDWLTKKFMHAVTRHKSNQAILYYIMSNKIDYYNNPELFNRYAEEYEDAYREHKIFNATIKKSLMDIFKSDDFDFSISTYHNSLTVIFSSDLNNFVVENICNDGFVEIENGTILAFANTKGSFFDSMPNVFPEIFKSNSSIGRRSAPLALTFQVTDDCNLKCTYCYQTNKGHHKMSNEIVDKAIDFLLFEPEKHGGYANLDRYPTILLDLVGGEGMLYPELTDYIIKTFLTRMINSNHPWLRLFKVHISTNGVNYFQDDVFKIYEKWRDIISISITVDGNKKLHDKCRLFHNGKGSYDLAHEALVYELKNNYGPSTKITLAPDNISYVKNAIITLIKEGFPHIKFNAVFEHNWTASEAGEYLTNLKGIADYIIDNDLYNHTDVSVLGSTISYKPLGDDNNRNWCGGDGSMLIIDYNGDAYNCLRYMESSLNGEQPPLVIGNIFDGIGSTECDCKNINCMKSITRRSQSSDECYNCPIASGCGWCTGYNYQIYGTPNKRSTSTCNIHKANALASAYFFNTIYKKINSDKRVDLSIPGADFFKDIIDPNNFESIINL